MKSTRNPPVVHDVSTSPAEPVVVAGEVDQVKTLEGVAALDTVVLIDALDPIRKAAAETVKSLMVDRGAKRAVGVDFGAATLGDSYVPRVISAGKFISRCQKAGIGIQKIHAALTVSTSAAEKLLGKEILAEISEDGRRPVSGKLSLRLKEGVGLTPAAAAAELAQRLGRVSS